jgi:phosphomevalonate kinase
VRLQARAPGKLVALGEYAVLEGAPALVLAIDRYAVATLGASTDHDCHLRTRMAEPEDRSFSPGTSSGVALVDTVVASAPAEGAWRGTLDSSAFFAGDTKLGLGSSAAALCAWAGVWAARVAAQGLARPDTTLAGLVRLHRQFQGGRGSGIDVAASFMGGVVEFRLDVARTPQVGSVLLPNSVGFAGIFAGRSASTPEFLAHFRAFQAARPAEAAGVVRRLSATAEAGCVAARGGAAAAFVEAIAEYGRGLASLGEAIGADIVTAEHRQIGEHARRHGVAYKVSGAGGGDLGLACALDEGALDAFKASVRERGFRVIELGLAERGLTVNELADASVGERWA